MESAPLGLDDRSHGDCDQDLSMTVAMVWDLLTHVTVGLLFFVPFALGLRVYVWRRRQLFRAQS